MGLTTRLQSMVPPAAKRVVSKQPSIRKLLRRVLRWEPGGPHRQFEEQQQKFACYMWEGYTTAHSIIITAVILHL